MKNKFLTSLFCRIFGTTALVSAMTGDLHAGAKPNIIYILADDLGYNDLGCYGQKLIQTPHIDRLAANGMKFSQHYSGSAVCAPTRSMLLTGLHAGHSQVRNNSARIFKNKPTKDNPEGQGQYPLAGGTQTIGSLLQKEGYKTCAVGKWGLGGPDNAGDPNKQGFDHFFGYLCQRQAHNYYPTHLWRNDKRVELEGNLGGKQLIGQHYAPNLILKEALGFIDRHHKQPFFLYYASIIPHVALQVPENDPGLAEYRQLWPDETPYTGQRGYLPHPTPHAAYAAMISRLDRNVGDILAKLKEKGIADNTLVIFTSDNGPTNAGGGGASHFRSAGELRALKGSLYEGGIRVPFVASWPGKIKAGSDSDLPSAGWDMLATFAELAGAKVKQPTDGISMVPTLLANGKQAQHKQMYWELGSQQALRVGDWKAYRRSGGPVQLYDLAKDIGEKKDVSAQFPEVLKTLEPLFTSARTEHPDFKNPATQRTDRKRGSRKNKGVRKPQQ